VRRLREFCDALSFDVVWFPGIRTEQVNIYNQLPAPWYFDGVQALLGPARADFTAAYVFDIRPATDDRPYFQNFFRWSVLTEAWRAKDRGGMGCSRPVTCCSSPRSCRRYCGAVADPAAAGPVRSACADQPASAVAGVAYFAGIGLAFLFVEIAFLQKLMLLVHHPTVALSLVLATFLLGAGAGSAWSSRFPTAQSRILLIGAVAGIVLLGALYGAAFDALIGELAAWPTAARALVAAGLLAPLAFCMGMPFPLALRELDEPLVPWAWASTVAPPSSAPRWRPCSRSISASAPSCGSHSRSTSSSSPPFHGGGRQRARNSRSVCAGARAACEGEASAAEAQRTRGQGEVVSSGVGGCRAQRAGRAVFREGWWKRSTEVEVLIPGGLEGGVGRRRTAASQPA